ncbi:WxcM-like domain-containing protein [bacterium]|nr:WxcM-like domain-containing protein [bacterium]
MLIHSARHITYLGRHLKINSPSEFSSDSTILVLTKSIDIPFNIKEKTRITSEEIAKSTGLRKFLKLSEGTTVKVGSFEIRMAEITGDKSKFNFFINNELYFMTFVPEIYFPFQENLTLLVQADPDYFSEDYFEKVQAFISKSHPAKTIISGNYSEKWFSTFKSRKNIAVRNEISQPGIF